MINDCEKVFFWTIEDDNLHYAKAELLEQVKNMDISLTGHGFFILNRHFLANVRIEFRIKQGEKALIVMCAFAVDRRWN